MNDVMLTSYISSSAITTNAPPPSACTCATANTTSCSLGRQRVLVPKHTTHRWWQHTWQFQSRHVPLLCYSLGVPFGDDPIRLGGCQTLAFQVEQGRFTIRTRLVPNGGTLSGHAVVPSVVRFHYEIWSWKSSLSTTDSAGTGLPPRASALGVRILPEHFQTRLRRPRGASKDGQDYLYQVSYFE